MDIHQVVHALNERSDQFEFGQLQQIRKDRLGLKKSPCKTPFGMKGTFEKYAFHVGGRCELQYNVGKDKSGLRWGVAVSLQSGPSLPDVTVQIPKLKKLSEFIRVHGDELLSDFLMWHWSDFEEEASPDQPLDVVPQRLYAAGYFVFLGKHAPIDDFDPDLVLSEFDRLLPLYKYVEFSAAVVFVTMVALRTGLTVAATFILPPLLFTAVVQFASSNTLNAMVRPLFDGIWDSLVLVGLPKKT